MSTLPDPELATNPEWEAVRRKRVSILKARVLVDAYRALGKKSHWQMIQLARNPLPETAEDLAAIEAAELARRDAARAAQAKQ